MGRSKKNWDQLVDFYGNYGIDIANGLFPGSGNAPGIKGNKGEVGFDGPKGQKGERGDKGNRGYGQKGDKGLVGPDGGKGEKGGPGGLFTFKGTITDESQLPPNAEPGDVYFNSTTGDLFAFDSNEWVNVGTISDPVKGEKGEEGDAGQKGEPGLDGAPGAGGAEGEKGQKGENYDPLVLDEYYKAGQIDQMIEHHHEPEKAFDVSYYKDQTSVVQNETVDFLSTDQQDELYNPGIVVIESTCTIENSPVSAARQIVVNYVVDNAGRLRTQGYQMIQHVFAAELSKTDDSSYWRLVRPNRSEFGEWHNAHFPDEQYYVKSEIDDKVSDQGLVFLSTAADNTEQLVLQDKNGNIDPTFVRFHSTGGITLTRNGNRLTFDGSPLAGQLLFMGLLGIDEDVSVTVPDPSPGNYFIFKENGTDVNTGEEVAVGDWLIYGEDPTAWRHLPMGVSYGVAEVRVKEEKPYLTKTGAIQFPELGFDTDDFERDFPAREGTIDVMNGSIWSLGDVKTDYTRNEIHGFDTRVEWNDGLLDGQYAIDIKENRIRIADKNAAGGLLSDFVDAIEQNEEYFMEATWEGRPENVAAKPTFEQTPDGYILNFDNRSVPVFCSSLTRGTLVLHLCLDRNDVSNGDSLVWNEAEQKFIADRAGKGVYVEVEGDTMKGELNMDENDLNGLANPPATDSSAVSKEWVLEQLSGLRQVPVGAIMFWASSKAIPQGWLKMDGSPFNVGDNPILHNILSGFKNGYTTNGRTPNWGGRFTFQTTGASSNQQENGGLAGQFASQRTADSGRTVKIKGEEGKHKHQWVRQGGRGAGTSTGSNVLRDKTSGAGNSKVTYYTDTDVTHEGQHNHNLIDWDDVTRPDSVAGYWIIKMD